MLWTLLALFALIILGGFISYYGDLQGRRWGKKRVSLFGMRPKHTAIFITSLTGAFIALLSIVTVLIAAPVLRDVVLRGEKAIFDNKRLNAEIIAERIASQEKLTPLLNSLKVTESDLTDVKRERFVVKGELHTAQSRLEYLRKDLKEKQIEIKEAQEKVQSLSARNQLLLKRQQELEGDLSHGKKMLASIQKQLGELARQNKDAEAINKVVGQQNVELTRDNLELERQKQKFEEENARLAKNNFELKQEGQELSRKNGALEEANKQQLAANRENQKQFSELQAKINELQLEQDSLYTRLAGAGQAFNQTFTTVRQGKMILQTGGELARRLIPAHLGPIAVRRELQKLLEDASVTAQRLGASQGENGRAVAIVKKRVVSQAGTVQNTNEQDSIDALVENLVAKDTDMVVLANAINNTVAGEQALIECTIRGVRPVFDKGAVVAEKFIDGRRPAEVVADAIMEFLREDISNAAKREGIIPQINPETGGEQVGAITTRDIVSLTDKVRRLRGRVRLEAIAAENLSSADNLRLTFAVTRAD